MSKSLGTFFALIGLVLSGLTFYYAQRNRAIDNRPILDITDAKLLSREQVGRNEFDTFELSVTNHGNRVSSPTVIYSRDFVGGGDLDDLGDIAPGQTIKSKRMTKFDDSKRASPMGVVHVVAELKYSDRAERSHSFADEVYLCAEEFIGTGPPSRSLGNGNIGEKLLGSAPVEPYPEYFLNPPEALHRCGSLDVGWNQR